MEERYEEIIVKDNEKIIWDLEVEWLVQFKINLEAYINSPRRKAKAHQLFANKLLEIIEKPPTNEKKRTTKELLREISNPLNLMQKGWDNKPSFLYQLCDVSYLKFFDNVDVKLQRVLELNNDEKQEIIDSRDQEISKLQGECDALIYHKTRLTSDNKELHDNATALEETITTLQKDINGLQNQNKQNVSKFDEELKNKSASLGALTSDNKELHSKVTTLQQDKTQLTSDKKELHSKVTTLQQDINKLQAQNRLKDQKFRELELKLKQQTQDTTNQKLDELSRENSTLRGCLKETEEKLSTFERLYTQMKTWVDNLFGESLGFKPSEYFENRKPPELSAAKIRAIRQIAEIQESKSKQNLEKALKTEVDNFKEGKTNLENALSDQFNDGINFIKDNGISFFQVMTKKVNKDSETPPQEDSVSTPSSNFVSMKN